jgi:hypothetical protein
MNETKPWYTSKTVWVGAAQIAIGAATAAGVIDMDAAVDAQNQAPEVISGLVGAVLGVATVASRVVANKRIGASE